MKIGLQTWGSDGDVRPLIALAGGLAARGHDVTYAVTSVDLKDYSPFGDALGFRVVSVQDGYAQWGERLVRIKDEIIRASPMEQVTLLFDQLLEPVVDEMYAVSTRLCEENDAVIGSFMAYPLQLAALKAGRPHAVVVWSPDYYPSRHRPPSTLPNLGPWINALWWKLAKTISNRMVLRYVNRLRERHGHPPAADLFDDVWQSRPLTLIAASPSLFPPAADWGDHLQVCGFFAVPQRAEEWSMPDDLRDFLDAGDPPVYLTFGSMPQPRAATELFVDAVRAAGCRAIIQARWSEMGDLARDDRAIHRIERGAHAAIFPRCALVVHHGGAGTTHSATLAGCPSIVIEHFGDQIFWGHQLRRAGLTTRMLHRRSVTAATLAAEIRKILRTPAMRTRAQRIAALMKGEDGVARAVALVESRLAG